MTVGAWKTKLINAVLVASGNHHLDKIINWLTLSWNATSMDKLDDSGGAAFVMLDIKLSSGMTEMLRKAGGKSKGFERGSNYKWRTLPERVRAS